MALDVKTFVNGLIAVIEPLAARVKALEGRVGALDGGTAEDSLAGLPVTFQQTTPDLARPRLRLRHRGAWTPTRCISPTTARFTTAEPIAHYARILGARLIPAA